MIERLTRWPRYALAISAHYSGLDVLYRRIAPVRASWC